MSWHRVDDRFAAHPKVEALEALGPERHAFAIAAWTLLGSDCSFLDDGGVVAPTRVRKVLAAWPESRRRKAIADLVSVGLFDKTADETRFHDWDSYRKRDRSADEVRAYEARRKSAQRARAAESKEKADSVPGHVPDQEVGTCPDPRARVLPSRPDPAEESVPSPMKPPRTQPGELGRVANLVQLAAIAGYRDAGIPAPRETRDMSWKGWADIARFLIDSAELQNWSEDWRDHRPAWLVERFLTDPWAEKRGYPIAHLASNPAEYVLRKTEAA